jgi:hypothetical protein
VNSQPCVLQIKDKMKTCSVIGHSFHTRCETNEQLQLHTNTTHSS